MTAGAIQDELRDFTVRLLERAGGLVEWDHADKAGSAVVSGEVATLLRMPRDAFPVSTQPVREGLSASLANDFLELAEGVLHAFVPRLGAFRVGDRYLKRGDLQEAVDRVFSWTNARAKVRDHRETSVEYHVWWFHAQLRSEDCWDTLCCVKVNSLSLGEVEFPDPFELLDVELTDSGDHQTTTQTLPAAAACAQRRVVEAARPFLDRMDARRQRDQKRLNDYYGSLRRQSAAPNRRTKTLPSAEDVEARTRAVQLELRRKLGELDERYTVDAALRPVALVRLEAPALALDLDVQRKQAHRLHTVYWNSLTKLFEPLACSACAGSTFAPTATNDAIDVLCAPCSRAIRRSEDSVPHDGRSLERRAK